MYEADALSIHFEIDFDELVDSLCPSQVDLDEELEQQLTQRQPLDLALKMGDGDKLAHSATRIPAHFTDKFVTALKLGY